MSRPLREGLDYFPLDVDFLQDERIRVLRMRHGHVAIFTYLALLAELYRVGMCFRWDALAREAFAESIRLGLAEVESIVDGMLAVGLFSKDIFEATGFLTSKGVQRRYLRVCESAKRKGAIVPAGVLVLQKSDFPPGVSVEEKEESKVKESKVKETPNKSPINPQLMGNKSPINPQETIDGDVFAETPSAPDDPQGEISTHSAPVSTNGHNQGDYPNQKQNCNVGEPRPFKGLEPRTDPDGWRRVGSFAGLDPIAYEQLSVCNSPDVVDRALVLVEGWVIDSENRTAHLFPARCKQAKNATGPLASWALSKAREQIGNEGRSKGKKTVEDKMRAIAAL